MGYKVLNNAYSTLATGINAVATTLQVATGHGDRFPVIAGADYTYITLEDASANIEIVKVTARATSSDSITIERAQDGTTARSWASGDIVELRLIAKLVDDALAHIDDTSGAHLASAITNTPSGSIAASTVQAAINELDTDRQANTAAIAVNAAAISDNAAAIAANASDISDNADAIAVNAAAIVANASDISDNADAITALDTAKLDIAAAASAAEFNAGTAENVYLNPKIARENSWVYLPKEDVDSGSGSAVTLTGIPAWATKIEMEGINISTNGTSGIGCVIGHAGALELLGYSGMCSRIGNSGGVNTPNSTRFTVHNAVIAAQGYDFKLYLSKHDGNTWFMTGSVADNAGANASFCLLIGAKTLSDTLTQISFQSASDSFDGSGTIVVRYS